MYNKWLDFKQRYNYNYFIVEEYNYICIKYKYQLQVLFYINCQIPNVGMDIIGRGKQVKL